MSTCKFPFEEEFNGSKIEQKIIDFINQFLEEADANGVIVGLSGGIDSTVSTTLAVKALGSWKVHGMILPTKRNKQENIQDAVEVAENLNIEYQKTDIEPLLESFLSITEGNNERYDLAVGNSATRLRMALEYFEANKKNYIVLGTTNRTERLLGYFTKYGDGGVDLLPIGDIYKTEVRKLAKNLNISEKIIEKQPTGGLWEGQTDLSELGESYRKIDSIFKLIFDRNKDTDEVANLLNIETKTINKYLKMYQESTHKRESPPTPDTYPTQKQETSIQPEINPSGKDSGITDAQMHHLLEVLSKRPSELEGYQAREWTPELLQDYILGVFGEEYSRRYIKRLMSALGHSEDY